MPSLTPLWHPALFQGRRATRGYFEGWYFKVVDAAGAEPLAIIPGVSIEPDGRRHAFVQLIRADGRAHWFDLPWSAFSSAEDRFELRMGACLFSDREIVMDIEDETASLRGRLALGAPVP